MLQCGRSSPPLQNGKYFLAKFLSLLGKLQWKNVALNIKFSVLHVMLEIYDFLQVLIMIKISPSYLLVHWNTSKVLLQTWHIWLLKNTNKKPYFPCQNLRCIMVLQWIYMLLPNAKRWKLHVKILEFLVHFTLVIFSLLESNMYFLRNCLFWASSL